MDSAKQMSQKTRKGQALPESKRKPQKNKRTQRRRATKARTTNPPVIAPGQGAVLASAPQPVVENQGGPLAWSSMMLNPRSGNTVLSPNPGGSAVLVSRARFNFVREIKYDAATQGKFIAVATPSVKDPLLLMTTHLRYPAAGNTGLTSSTMGLEFAGLGPVTPGAPTAGYLHVTDPNTGNSIRVLNRRTIAGQSGWDLSFGIGTSQTVVFINKSNRNAYLRIGYYAAGAWGFSPQVQVMSQQQVTQTTGPAAAQLDAVTIQVTDAAGVPLALQQPLEGILLDIQGTGFVPATAGPGSVGEFVTDEMAEQGRLENVRVTAMSLLVSPIGQWAQIGGRMVMARTLARNVISAGTVDDLMSTIENLNDPNIWLDVPLARGAYAWWMPDDTQSYLPHPYNQQFTTDENVLVLAGRMEADNAIRLVATYVVEFYSPKQVFTKTYGPVLAGPYEKAYQALLQVPCVSENDEHETLIAKAQRYLQKCLRNVPKAVALAQEWGPTVASAATMAASML
jgi:hypothetical protein